MEKELLHKFFAGTATLEEKEAIMHWMESDPDNKQFLLKERKLYNAVLLHGEDKQVQQQAGRQQYFLRRGVARFLRVAAMIVVAFGLGYFWQSEKTERPIAMQTISVPAGQCVNVTLPDGSNIWLNAQTTIQYPVSFNKENRQVKLDGEAYFDVAKDSKRPFIVNTKECSVEVLGTKFNIDAYSSRDKFETVLMEGSVKVSMLDDPTQAVSLKPNNKVYRSNGKLLTQKVSNYERYRWKEGLICFVDEPFKVVMEDFEKFYGLTIVVNNQKVTQYLYTGKFKQTDGVDYALSLLQKNIHFTYQRDRENHIVYIN
ncbi:FecR family protein [Parabacteroides gordonii]|jgi:transmembrane sensor|uniref:FecR family protein n=1 Tax=Parabacteroides gordonii TaxID=574930 RepID=UPI00241E72EE|nr:FecR family protein [Parabacteroides gordonii]